MIESSEDEVISDLMGAIRSYARGSKRALRYQLEDDYGLLLFPHKVKMSLIPRSRSAVRIIEESGYKGSFKHGDMVALGLTYEHMVPLSVLGGMLLEARDDPQKVKGLLKDYYQVCWVTKAEDRELNALGLKSKMPEGWAPGGPADARYRAAGIELS